MLWLELFSMGKVLFDKQPLADLDYAKFIAVKRVWSAHNICLSIMCQLLVTVKITGKEVTSNQNLK